jgi:hypothetical protein
MVDYRSLEAHTEGDRRLLDRIAVIGVCLDGAAAMNSLCF